MLRWYCGCKSVSGYQSGYRRAFVKSKGQCSMEERGVLGLSQEVNEYRTREYHYS